MKKLAAILLLTCPVCVVLGQQSLFKPIHFKSYRTTTWRPLDFNSQSDGPDNSIAGTIDINVKDSVIAVVPDGQAPLKYKIKNISPEQEDKRTDTKTISLNTVDAAGKDCYVKIERVIFNSSYRYMKVSFAYSGIAVGYMCDYVKKIIDTA